MIETVAEPVVPEKLKPGDAVRVIAPSFSMSVIGSATLYHAQKRFEEDFGLTVTYGRHATESDEWSSSTVEARVEDLHEAFMDNSIKAVLPVHGGWNAIQLLDAIDWGIIKSNPKIFCGFSDISLLSNALFKMTDMVTYVGPNFSTFGQLHLDPYTLQYYEKCLFQDSGFEIESPQTWTDDKWYIDQEQREYEPHDGHWPLAAGTHRGAIIGGNLSSLGLLCGTDYFPDVSNPIAFLEEERGTYQVVDRSLRGMMHTLIKQRVGAVVLGKFQRDSAINRDALTDMIEDMNTMEGLPVLGNVCCSHVDPKLTLPIGGTAVVSAGPDESSCFYIERH